ncbi:DUF2062 domain-containing protein [uncultured Lentibacter sp.]|mgnify:CR=1 FL=1|uniref:DUF2062 domain-containing protein n=1 Tax=uncultured Lentibacter sp. TaxID=1659309 RepID=UPI00260A9F3F|nr:DUF2062 domain-containing protein [uncultured Lentibacter sp.]
MVFKRRDKRAFWKVIADFIYPKGGWARAFHYVRHRLHRLPDPPHKIARGVWAGVFTTFTPFYGMHFLVAALIARIMQGNIIAALLATFFGNPLTYIPIGVSALKTGHWLLGTEFEVAEQKLGAKFAEAGEGLFHNFLTVFTEAEADWHGLAVFYDEVFFPYLIGGILPGIVTATICYYISVPLIRAYQNRRKGRIKEKLAALRKKKPE